MIMEEKPKIVITRTRRPEPSVRDFGFNATMLPAGGALDAYRAHAWETYSHLAMPNVKEEAWRRTDLRLLPADTFRLPVVGAFKDLAPVPEELLRPLTAESQAGQVVLLPGGARCMLDPVLERKHVVFTDLRTAEMEHPDLVARMAGELVRPEEGKFAALAGAFSQNGVVLYVPKGVTIENPLNSLLWGPGVGLAHVSHILVWVDEGASVTYVHEAASPDEGAASMHAGIVEIKVA